MKFLLVGINAKYIHSNPAIYSLQAYGREKIKGIQAEIAEYTINNQKDVILADIYNRKPDIIGFSCYIWNWNMVQDIMVELYKILPKVPIWLGGPEVSYEYQSVLETYHFLTGIMLGEGEKTFAKLLHYYESGKGDLQQIPGIATKDGITPMGEILSLDEIPFLYQDLTVFENRIIYYESSRGCPYRCSYCLSSIDKSVRLRSFSLVAKELQFFLDNEVAQVKFIDRTFNCNHKHAIQIWQYIYEHDNGFTNFHFEISADIISEEELELLNKMRPGLVQLEIGVQSTNEKTIKEIYRTMDLERLKKVYYRIEEGRNIHQHLDLIAGLPYENYESFQNSFNEIYALHPEQLQLGFLKVLKGAYIFEKVDSYGIGYQSKPAYEVLFTNWLTYEEVLKLKAVEEMVELYYNSNQYIHTLKVLETVFATPFAMYEALADFYEKSGYAIASPSRAYRYNVLLAFAVSVDRKNEELYKELLTFDCYLRENMKTRPGYSKDLSIYKEKFRVFYSNEESMRQLLPNYGEYTWKQVGKMTHGDVFSYSVWEEDINLVCKKMLVEKIVIFDYKKRDALTKQANVVVIDEFVD